MARIFVFAMFVLCLLMPSPGAGASDGASDLPLSLSDFVMQLPSLWARLIDGLPRFSVLPMTRSSEVLAPPAPPLDEDSVVIIVNG
ncbi:MAG: hypothetical protein AAF772_05635 [Acidobacteriota bacterium]